MLHGKSLSSKNFYVIGDVIIDYYRVLSEKRLSPEAPVIVFNPESEEYKLGGAANVANNIHAMGGNASLFSVAGADWGMISKSLIPFRSDVIASGNRLTTVKERLITKRQQIARIDTQSSCPISPSDEALLSLSVGHLGCDVVVMSDYDHGVMTPSLCDNIISSAKGAGIPVVVNSKAKDTMPKYAGATILVLNLQEAKDITGMNVSGAVMAEVLVKEMGLKAIAITMGAHGILLGTGGGGMCESRIFPPLDAGDDEVIDVTGAGDTVTAAVAAGIATPGMSYASIMKLANVAAGVVVKKRGVATASMEEVNKAILDKGIDLGGSDEQG